MTDLLPCPFCQGTPEIHTKGSDATKTRRVTIRCKTCRIERTDAAMRNGMEWLVTTAVANWNLRASPWRPMSECPDDGMEIAVKAYTLRTILVYARGPKTTNESGDRLMAWMPIPAYTSEVSK